MAEINLSQKFPRLTPSKSPPALMRINGCGTGIYGKRDYDAETGTYVVTFCISLLFVPVLCLRAYRVAKAPRGWYFLGREPLSGLARAWNVVPLLAALVIFSVVKYNAYTSSPAYQAKQQMNSARLLAETGQLAQAAKGYQALAVTGGDESANATKALKDLMDGPCQTASLGDSAGVFASAAQVARRGNAIAASEVADKGLKLVDGKGDADPRGGVAMLDVVRPLVMDTRAVDARRLLLLRKWAAAEPANQDIVVSLASLLEQEDHADEAKKLLLPFKDKLGDGEGAQVLGTVFAHEGDLDGAYALLWPYVKSRLDRLHAAEKASEDAQQSLWDREVKLLDDNQAPADFYDRYKSAGKDQQRAMVREYVNGRIKDDPKYTSTQDALEREAAVVPVALELGIVMTQRAQGQSDTDARKTQLESAEQVFLAIGGVAGETNEYRLSLGQVYYWLGKQSEGHKLFDDFLTANGRKFEDLLKIAKKLRLLGAVPEARAMAEEAYNKTSEATEKHEAAFFRSACFTDLDDQIAWLNKADLSDPAAKASLAKALGAKAFQEGRDDEAGRQYQVCIDAYNAMPRSDTTLNETALAYYGIFEATGDRQALDRCLDNFQQAVDLDPSDTILLYNAGVTLLEGALADIIGNDIDLHALHESGSLTLVGYLYNDQAGHEALAKRVREHPGLARALSYLEKVTVLSPKNANAFFVLYSVHQFTHNEPALQALEQRAKAANLDTSDQLADTKNLLSGAKDAQNLAALNVAIKRAQDMEAARRAKGGRTAAVALDEEAEQLMNLDSYTPNADLDKAVALAREAWSLNQSTGTEGVLTSAYLVRAARGLRGDDSDFNAFYGKYNRSLGVVHVIAAAAAEASPFQHKVLQHPDVMRALDMMRDEARRFPDGRSSFEWALFKNVDPAEAEHVAQVVRKTPRKALEQSIDNLLRPYSATEAMNSCWLSQIEGKQEEGLETLNKVAAMGIPLPIGQVH